MNDGAVARPAVPPNICFYDFLFDKKKEKIKIFVCVRAHVKQKKIGNGHQSKGNLLTENRNSPFTVLVEAFE